MSLAPPFTRFGRYRILQELGRGAMGIVYLCEDESLQRQVAVKAMLLPADTADRSEHEARFRQEAKAAGGLNHPNIITIHDLGREGDWLYIAMELLQGVELRDLLARGPLPPGMAADIAAQVARGLAAAHERGVVHRDVKPSNVMLLGGRHAKIMDFGVARMQASELRTRTGTLLGSPKYMSPEQVGGHPVDHRSDIFSLGSVLYEMVSGQPPFHATELGKLLNDILHATPPAPSTIRAEVPPALDHIIAKCMQKNPAARYQDARELARELAEQRGVQEDVDATTGNGVDIALFAGSVDPAETLRLAPAPPPGLPLAQGFDSKPALERLLRELAKPAPAGAGDAPPRRRIGGWGWAGIVAAVAAVLIAVS